eukprot:11157383-Lingulodinium_polyedra.AAC.1
MSDDALGREALGDMAQDPLEAADSAAGRPAPRASPRAGLGSHSLRPGAPRSSSPAPGPAPLCRRPVGLHLASSCRSPEH